MDPYDDGSVIEGTAIDSVEALKKLQLDLVIIAVKDRKAVADITRNVKQMNPALEIVSFSDKRNFWLREIYVE